MPEFSLLTTLCTNVLSLFTDTQLLMLLLQLKRALCVCLQSKTRKLKKHQEFQFYTF